MIDKIHVIYAYSEDNINNIYLLQYAYSEDKVYKYNILLFAYSEDKGLINCILYLLIVFYIC